MAWGRLFGGLLSWLRGARARKRERFRSARAARKMRERLRELREDKTRVEAFVRSSMDPLVAELMMSGRLRNEKRRISVLFADLESFTTHAEREAPETVIGDLDRLYSSLQPAIDAYRGHLDKFMGDGLMAEFGVPRVRRQHALLAVLAGFEMQRRLQTMDFPCKMRVGIATGPCIVGLVGAGDRRTYTALGDTVNLAARLQGICPPGKICLDETAYRETRQWLRVRRIREGTDSAEERDLQARLKELAARIEFEPNVEQCLEAAELCAELGETEQAMRLYRRAITLAPERRKDIETLIGSVLLGGEDKRTISIKGKADRIGAYEVLGLKDPLDDRTRIPSRAGALCKDLISRLRLPDEVLTPMEALDGSLGHSRTTAALAAALAEDLGLDEQKIREVFLAGYLHDIGMLAVPEHLLGLEDSLTDLPARDRERIRAHVQNAEQVIARLGIPHSPDLLRAVTEHHERCNGSGYPRGLRGSEISLSARILQIAEIYESLTAWRPYRDAWERGAALAEIRKGVMEGWLDRTAGERFLRLIERCRSRV